MPEVQGKQVAILAADGVEQVEFTEPKQALEQAGVNVTVISLEKRPLQAFQHNQPGDSFEVDLAVDEAKAEDYDALYIPGGVMSPDTLRGEAQVQQFTRDIFDAKKPVFSICHGPQVLISAGVVKGRKMTGYQSIRIDLENAGAQCLDQEVVTDKGLVTSRGPDDLPAFCNKMLEELAEGPHTGRARAARGKAAWDGGGREQHPPRL